MRIRSVLLALTLVGILVACTASKEEATETATAVPAECDPNSPCAGSTCPTAITSALATQPVDACPRFGEFQSDVDVFSWNSFIAMNWPADPTTCGPDLSRSILDNRGPVVWQTMSEDTEVYVAPGQKPTPWCSKSFDAPLEFRHVGKASATLLKGFPDILEAVGGPLTDQNGRFVRYQKLVNYDEYNYLISNNLWNLAGQKGQTISFPTGPKQDPGPCNGKPCGPTGAMEIKSTWKVLTTAEILSKRFYMAQAIVYNDAKGSPSPGKNPVVVGLVGFHIIHKTPTQNTWFWSTFEQVDNTTKSFYNPNCPSCPVNQQTAAQPYTELNPDGTPRNQPVQVTRVTPIATNDSAAVPLNAYYRGLLRGSVWENYQLISTQWATGGAPAGTPAVLANTTLETYIQANSSCLGCHKGAKTRGGQSADFSFLVYEAQ